MLRRRLHLTILGAGPAGLATAYYAHRQDIPFLLFEASAEVGGLCRTLRCSGHAYDTGAHRFHDRLPEITRDLRGLLGESLYPVTTPSKIYVAGRFIDFPPTPLSTLRSSGWAETGRVGLDLIRSRLWSRTEKSFADFARNRFGETLARKFLLNYSEKVWGLPADQLSPDIATRRLSGMTLGSLLLEFFFSSRKAAHIDGDFLYPRSGYGEICRALAESLPAESIYTRHPVNGLECGENSIQRILFDGCPSVDVLGDVVSTLPLTLAVQLLGSLLPGEIQEVSSGLRFRDIRLVFLRLAKRRVSRNATIYLPESPSISRVHEPKNRSPAMAPENETSLVVEIPCFPDEPIATMPEEKLFERITDELQEMGLTRHQQVIEWRHHHLRNAYPVYSIDYSQRVSTILSAMARVRDLHLLGRNGRFFYSHLHQQMSFGKELVERLGGKPS